MIQALQTPANRPYKIKQSLIIAQSAEMRVIDQTLAPGEAVPWHLHPESDDYIICLRGALEVREINPEKVTTLRALERCLIPSNRPHTTVNASNAECQFLIVQGPGHVEFRALPKLETSAHPRNDV